MSNQALIVFASILLSGAIGCASTASDDRAVVSPDGNVCFQFLQTQPKLLYSVTLKNKHVVEPSPIVMFIDGHDVTARATAGGVERYSVNETYPTRGVHSTAVDHCNGARFSFTHSQSKTAYALDVRAYDDGVAFRIVAPASSEHQKRVPDEATAFSLPSGSTTWFHGMGGHYEGEYKQTKIDDLEPNQWAGPPMTYRLPDRGGYASITEANLVNYSGMALESDGHRGFVVGLAHVQPVGYPFELRYSVADVERLSQPAVVTGTIATPWRVVLVGEDLDALVNSDVISNLCPPPDPKLFPDGLKTEWVKPGRAVWRYLDNPRATTAPEDRGTRPPAPTSRPVWPRLKRGELGPLVFGEHMQGSNRRGRSGSSRPASRPTSRQTVSVEEINDRWTEPAAQLGFEHNILEGFWRGWSREQLKQVVDFGKQHGVGIWLWKHSQDLRDPAARREFFEMCRDVGVAGAKIDFFDHEHKEMIDLYQAILHDAAEYHVLLDFHGANKPTGESRTWPNELTREAIRGMEASRLKDRAVHEATLPFTRFLAGHAEYTPMHFGDRRGDTTWAHQVALPVIFTTELMTYAASPKHILESAAADVVKSIPSTWDETRVLPPSGIGEVAVFARRKGTTWFLAIANGPAERSVKVPLAFLDPNATYRAKLVKDTERDRAAMDVTNASYSREDAIEVKLVAGGGFVARFEK